MVAIIPKGIKGLFNACFAMLAFLLLISFRKFLESQNSFGINGTIPFSNDGFCLTDFFCSFKITSFFSFEFI